MLPDCPFLESNRRKWWLPRYACAMGVNFYSVGPERELCHTCPIADWGQILTCEHLAVYTFLRTNAHGALSVEAQMDCHQANGSLSDEARCAICPEVRAASFEPVPGVVILGDAAGG